MITGIYQIRNIMNNKRYVGSASGKGFDHRWRFHIDTLNKNKHHNSHLQNAWNKYGKDKFVFSILEECKPNECLIREQFYIDGLNPEYNIYRVAGSPQGRIVSQETKEKISKSLTGHIIPLDVRNKISLSLKGKPKSEAHKNKVSSLLWGKNGKLRNSKGGRFSGYYIFFNIKTKEKIVCGKFELADKYNLDRSSVSKICNGKRKVLKKEWIYLGKEN